MSHYKSKSAEDWTLKKGKGVVESDSVGKWQRITLGHVDRNDIDDASTARFAAEILWKIDPLNAREGRRPTSRSGQ